MVALKSPLPPLESWEWWGTSSAHQVTLSLHLVLGVEWGMTRLVSGD